MADNNRNRYNQEDEYRNRENYNYGNVNYGGAYNDYGNPYEKRNEETFRRQQGSWQNSGSYGNQYGREDDWNRNQGGYSSNYGRADWERRNVSGGYEKQNKDYQDRNHGSNYGNISDHQNEVRNIYGGDTRNYGNANQGGFDRDWWRKTRDEVSSWFGDEDAERRRKMDESDTGGGYRGKGPKNYNRSQERIREDVCDRLTDDEFLDATNIEVKVEGNEVILAGTVETREQKRRAEDLVESISGVRNVENRIRVGRSDEF